MTLHLPEKDTVFLESRTDSVLKLRFQDGDGGIIINLKTGTIETYWSKGEVTIRLERRACVDDRWRWFQATIRKGQSRPTLSHRGHRRLVDARAVLLACNPEEAAQPLHQQMLQAGFEPVNLALFEDQQAHWAWLDALEKSVLDGLYRVLDDHNNTAGVAYTQAARQEPPVLISLEESARQRRQRDNNPRGMGMWRIPELYVTSLDVAHEGCTYCFEVVADFTDRQFHMISLNGELKPQLAYGPPHLRMATADDITLKARREVQIGQLPDNHMQTRWAEALVRFVAHEIRKQAAPTT